MGGRVVNRTPNAQSTRPCRWVVALMHSWFTRFRKLLVRFETLHRSYLALTILEAAIIRFSQVPANVSTIYG